MSTTTVLSPEAEQAKALEEAREAVKKQSFYMKRNLDQEKMPDALNCTLYSVFVIVIIIIIIIIILFIIYYYY